MQNNTTKNFFSIRLVLLVGTILIVAIILIDAFSDKLPQIGSMGQKGSKNLQAQEELKKADGLLHARLWQLQDMDQQFASSLSTQKDESILIRTNESILNAEEAFRKSIDSIAAIGKAYDEEFGTNDFQNMLTFFNKILDNRRFIAFTRMGVISGGEGSANEKQTIFKLQNDLYEKEKIIASSDNNKTVTDLQQQLAEKDKMIAALENKESSPDQKGSLTLQNELTVKNKQISDLQTQVQSEKQNYTQTIQKLQSELGEKNKLIATAGNRTTPGDPTALITLKNEIAEKDRRIKSLETQLRRGTVNTPADSESVKDLQQKNNNLRLAYNNTMTQLGVLQKKYNLLKAEAEQ